MPPEPPPVATPAPDPRLQPPSFAPTATHTPEAREDQRTRARRQIIEAVWQTVRDRHYDPKLGGVDWQAARLRYEPLALGAPDDAAFYRILNQMIGELGQSHMLVSGPGADDEAAAVDPAAPLASPPSSPAGTQTPNPNPPPPAAASATAATTMGAPVVVDGIGEPGIVVRSIEGRPIITTVRPGSSAARKGLKPGFVIQRIGGHDLKKVDDVHRSMRPVEERFALRRAAAHRLQGPVGSKVTVEYLDNDDRPGRVVLDCDAPPVPARQLGHLPPLYPESHATVIDGIGVISFNLFLLEPTLAEVKRAMDRFRAIPVKAVILDLRGNPGGIGAMSIPVAAEFVAAPTTLGTIHFRTFTQTFTAQPSLGRTPFTGPLVILTDEGSASTSEILAGGLQEAGRARIIGDATLGAVLPSVVESLPGGAVMQVVVADFVTPKGVLLEGRGVQPDQRVVETRAAFKSGQDVVLRAALDALRGGRTTTRDPAHLPRKGKR